MDTGLEAMLLPETVAGPGVKHSGPRWEHFVDESPYGAS